MDILRTSALMGIVMLSVIHVTVGVTCTPPDGVKMWDPNPGDVVYDVVWGITNVTQNICMQDQECSKTEDSSPVQLRPLEIQEGNILRFISTHNQVPIKPMLVDKEGFRSCNTSQGRGLVTSPTNQTITVDTEFLSAGTHYFIDDSTGYSVVHDCAFGLRVKVVVKPNNCGVDDLGANCSARGLCASYKNQSDYRCMCCGTYQGDACQDYNPCLSNPCGEGGQCNLHANDSSKFTCQCSLEYHGEFCQHKRENLCDVVKCANGANCSGNSDSFHCACPNGFTGSHCEVDINECETSPCEHGGVCVDQTNDFMCHCRPGFYGKRCSKRKRPCSLSPCQNFGFCQDLTTDPGNFRFMCHCLPGWTGIDCSNKTDACQQDSCSYRGECYEDSLAGFVCRCHPGFAGSRCEVNIDDCVPNPCRHGGHCRDTINGHMCLCFHSYLGSNCEYAMDLFSPILEGSETEEEREESRRSLIVVALVLSISVCVVLVVLIVCYCRMSGAYKYCCRCVNLRSWWNRKQYGDNYNNSLSYGVDVSSASDCPLAVDNAFKREDGTTGPYSRYNGAFDNEAV